MKAEEEVSQGVEGFGFYPLRGTKTEEKKSRKPFVFGISRVLE